MVEIAELVTTYGIAVAIIIYFLFKDYKFNDSIITLMTEVKEVLVELRTWHSVEESEKK